MRDHPAPERTIRTLGEQAVEWSPPHIDGSVAILPV